MNNKKTKKMNGKFGLGKRILAVVLAVAMVISISYIGNYISKKSAKADGETIPTVENVRNHSWVKDLLLSDDGAGNISLKTGLSSSYAISVPAKGMKFCAPSKELADGLPATIYQNNADSKYYYQLPDGANPDDYTACSTKLAIHTEYNSSEVKSDKCATCGNVSFASGLDTGVIHFFAVLKFYLDSSDSQGVQVEDLPKSEGVGNKIEFTVTPEVYALTVTENAAHVYTIADANTDTKYYGTKTYTVSKDGIVNTTLTKLSDINTYFATPSITKDGDYIVKEIISSGSDTLATVSKSFTWNAYNIGSLKYDFADGAPVTAPDFSLINGAEASASRTDVDLDAEVKVTFTTVAPLTETNFSATLEKENTTNFEAAAPKYELGNTADGNGLYTNVVTIKQTDKQAANGNTALYKIAVTEGGVTKTITVTLTYENVAVAAPTLRVKNANTVDGINYVTKTPATITVNSDNGARGVDTSSLELYKLTSETSTIATDATAVASENNDATPVNPFEKDMETGDLTVGTNYFAARAKGSEGVDADSDPVIVFYDPDEPVVSKGTLAQDAFLDADSNEVTAAVSNSVTATTDAETKATTIVFAEKVSNEKAATISFAAADITDGKDGKNGSGVSSVSVDGTVITPDKDGNYAFTIAANTVTDTSKDFALKVTDLAGNTKNVTITVPFVDETAKITGPSLIPQKLKDATDYLKLSSISTDKTVTFDYVIKSEVPVLVDETASAVTVTSATGNPDIVGKTIKDTGKDADGLYTYKVSLKTDEIKATTEINGIKITVTNVHGVATTSSAFSVIKIDMTAPTGTQGVYNTAPYASISKVSGWYQTLYIVLVPSDSETGVDAGAPDTDPYTEPACVDTSDGVVFTRNTASGIVYQVNPSQVNRLTGSVGTDVKFVVKDRVGNLSADISNTYYVDNENPKIDDFQIEAIPEGLKVYPEVPKFSGQVSDNISVSKVEISVKKSDETTPTLEAVTVDTNNKFADFQPAGVTTSGTYEAKLVVTDQAGNEFVSEEPLTFVYDKDSPVITTSEDVTPSGNTIVKACKVTFTVKDANLDVSKIVVTDRGEVQPVTFKEVFAGVYEGTYELTSANANGPHKIIATATDKANNKVSSTPIEYTYDTNAPEVTAKIDGTDYAPEEGDSTMHITGVDPTDPSAVAPKFEYSVNDNISKDTDSAVYSYRALDKTEFSLVDQSISGKSLDLTKDGTYWITVTATDTAENTSTTTFKILVNAEKPALAITQNSEVTSATVDGVVYYQDAAKLDFSITGHDLENSSFTIKDGENVITPDSDWTCAEGTIKYKTSATIPLPDKKVGSEKHTVTLNAKNKSGTAGTQASVSFVLDSRDPDITTKLNDEVYEDTDKDTAKRVAGAVSLSASNDDANAYDISGTVTREDFNGNVVSTTAVGPATDYKNISYSIPAGEENNGVYTFKVSAKDKAGRTNTKSFTFVVDNTAPVVEIIPEIDFKLVEGYYQETVILDLGITDDDINTDTFVVKDGDTVISPDSEWVQNGNKYTNKVTIALPDEAKETESHSITVSCVDKTNNPGTKNFEFVLDSKNPVVTAIIRDSVYTSSENTSFKNSDNKDGGTTKVYSVEDEANKYSYTATYNFTSFDPNVASVTGGVINNPAVFEAANDGKYEITYVATDKSGRVNDEKTKTITFIVDNKNPELTLDFITTPSSKDSRYYNDAVAMSYSAADSDMKSYTLTDNGVVVASGNAGVSSSYTIIKQASFEGSHKVVLTSTDNSGNTSSKTLEFYMDFTAPSMSAVLNGSSIASNNAVRYLQADGTITTAVTDNLGNDTTDITRTVVMTKPDKTSTTTTNKIGAGSETFTTEADYVVTYTAVDLAGNSSTFGPINFRVDKTAPALKITGVNGTANHDVTVSFGMEEAFYWDIKNATVKVYKKIDGQSESLLRTVDFKASGLNSTMSETFTEDGEYRFEFTAEDMAGNTANANYTFIMDKNAPLITLSVENYAKTKDPVDFGVNLIEGFYTSNKVTLSGTRTDIDGKKTDVKFDDYNFKSQRESNFLQQFKEDGIYDITVTAVDAAGNKSEKSVHFTIDKTAPEIGDLSKYDGTTVNKFEFDMNNADLYKDLTTCDITVYLDGIEWDGSSALDDGSHVLKVVATDELGNSSEKEVTFLLDTKAPTILVTGIKDGDRIEDPTTITVTVQLDSDKLTNVQLNGQLIEIKDNKAEIVVNKKGDYKLTATAEDEAGNESSIEMNFAYGAQFNFVLLIIIVAAALVLGALVFFLVKGKKKSE